MADNTKSESLPRDIPRWNQDKGRVEYPNGEAPEERILRLREEKRQASIARGFDLRSEVSEDARYISGRIVTHLWIIFVLLPVMLGVLFSILYAVVKP